MQDISWLGAIAGTILSFVLGGFWYSKAAFGQAWATHSGLSKDQIASANPRNMILVSLPLILVSALVFAAFLGEAALGLSVGAGFAAGLFWVGASFGVNYVFEQKSMTLWFINAGYHTAQFTLIGLCVGLANTYL